MHVWRSVVLHVGTLVEHGHYTCLLRHGNQWLYKDAFKTTPELTGLNRWHEALAYVILLIRSG